MSFIPSSGLEQDVMVALHPTGMPAGLGTVIQYLPSFRDLYRRWLELPIVTGVKAR
jgi:hypothetical protein